MRLFDTDNIDNKHETSKNSIEDGKPRDDLLGNNTVNDADSPVVPQTESDETPKLDKCKKASDAICKTWSEVKLLQMKSSDVKYYLNKAKYPKGDNTKPDPPSSPVRLCHADRPLRRSYWCILLLVYDMPL